MSKDPKILKKAFDKNVRESGCCFTSCGGSPLVIQDDALDSKRTVTAKKLGKI